MLGLTGRQSIVQSITNVIKTPKGSVPFLCDFGLSAENFLGGVADVMVLRKEIMEQLERYEHRIEVKKININTKEMNAWSLSIIYKIKATGEELGLIINN